MRTAEESSGTVLHRLIQEQLRYGNPTDTTTLLAIQQQALRGGSNSSSGGGGGGGTGSPRSSLESLTQEESQFIHMSTRQDPQGQEYQGDYNHCESDSVCHLYQLHRHGEELPTYEEAKAHSQYLASVGAHRGQGLEVMNHQGGGQWDLKREHARSLSERLMQLSLERNAGSCGSRDSLPLSSTQSYPQLSNGHCGPVDHQGPESLQYPDQRGPPPDYPFLVRPPGYMLSHSQETHGHYHQEPPSPFHSQHRYEPAHAQMIHHSVHSGPEVYTSHSNPSTHNNSAQMDLLRENQRLRKELEGYSEKAARLQKLEVEIQRISEAYETLMKGSAKREILEKTMRNKLESEIKRLHDFNRDLRDRLDTATKQRVTKDVESANQKQQVFAKLLEQNEEQQREMQCLRDSGEEWLRRREVLELALGSAQTRNLALEEELRRKKAYVEKVERLQSALGQLQAACEKRESLELRLRTRLEQELKSIRSAQSHSTASGPGSLPSDLSSMVSVQQQLAEREERILALEADITHWEQKYLEESTMRQFAMDAAATAAAQRDSSIIKHSPRHSPNNSFNNHLPSSHRHQEMENRIRALHSKLLEKDAVIRVLQQRTGPEQQALRPARSVPSISTAANTSTSTSSTGPVERPIWGKGKSLSDDQTAAAVSPLSRPPHQHPRAPLALPLPYSEPQRTDHSSQCDSDVPAQKADLTVDLPSSSDTAADVVEILI
ncbi:angiomotin-like 2a isoform X2 [Salmo trutta]|uniref:Angiomotin like 2a n=1 Tax=Salmo trutta TaxID=8032 RepID=A0A673ZNI1_SALTR|nr:angiomotin-like 2a isoform X2 [Salmo trutta]